MTIALTKVERVEEYGIAELGEDMRIKRFLEKPAADKAPSKLANAGIYLLSPEARKIVENEEMEKIVGERGRLDFGYDFIPYLVDNDYPVYGYPLKAWFDVGNPQNYLKAMHDLLYGALDIRVTEERIFPERNVWVQGYSEESLKRREEIVSQCKGGKLVIDGAALIGRHTRIGDDCRIVDSNIDHFCIIGEHVNVERSAIGDAARIGEYTHIEDSILGRKVTVESSHESPTFVQTTSVIGSSALIRKGCRIVRTRINPGLMIPPGMTYIDKFLQSYEDVVCLAEH